MKPITYCGLIPILVSTTCCFAPTSHAKELPPDGVATVVSAGADIVGQLGSDVAQVGPVERAAEPAVSEKTIEKKAGVVDGSTLVFILRNFNESLRIKNAVARNGWVQSARLILESGYTEGLIGLGLDLGGYSALKLNGGRGTRNMVYVPEEGSNNKLAWGYIGEYALKARIPGAIIKHGLLPQSNPFLEPYDVRALPPTWKGTSIQTDPLWGFKLKAGSFNAVNARGADYLRPLSTTYSGTKFKRLSYVGIDGEVFNNGTASLYASRAQDIWSQTYASFGQLFGDPNAIRAGVQFDGYRTRSKGDGIEGAIKTDAAAAAFSVQIRHSTILLGLQKIRGAEYFDYIGETSGIFLTNSMGVDYNSPNEKSVQLRYTFDGNLGGVKGFKIPIWFVRGSGVNGRQGAERNSEESNPLRDLYWKDGKAVSGSHHEIGMKPSYIIQSGILKDTKAFLAVVIHRVDAQYPSRSFNDFRWGIEKQIKIF